MPPDCSSAPSFSTSARISSWPTARGLPGASTSASGAYCERIVSASPVLNAGMNLRTSSFACFSNAALSVAFWQPASAIKPAARIAADFRMLTCGPPLNSMRALAGAAGARVASYSSRGEPMRDLTQGPIPGHLVAMAAPIAAGMLAQTLYFLIDLYFVAQLGEAALAGVGAAGIAMFVVMALTQTLGVGTMALVSQAVGRKDPADADLVFNQAMSLALVCTVATLAGGYALAGWYMRIVGADEPTIEAGITYLGWFLPGLALQYVNMVMISGLRGTGVVQPTMVVQIATVILNAILAPVLIAGWLTGKPLGVAGAGLASTVAVAAGTLMLALYFRKLEKYIHMRPATWRPQWPVWGRMVNI